MREPLLIIVAVLGIACAVLLKRDAKREQRFCEMLAARVDRLHAMTTESEKNYLTHYVPIFRHECQQEQEQPK